jgi:2-methylcitrate dehydratase PrpD
MSDYLTELARWIEGIRFQTLPASTVAATRLVLLDTLGAIVAGSAEKENARLASLASARSARSACTLIGHGGKADAAWAALANATAGVALEVDEGNRLGGGHPAIHTIPGALAVAEDRALDGRALLTAIATGYEIGSRLGGATTARPNVHSHGTWGTISSAVAAAKLADCSAHDVRAVINLAASMSPANSWTPALVGATIRNLYPGRSSFQGVLALDLLDCGFTAPDDAPSDVYGTILGDRFDPTRAVAGLGESYRIEENYFKFHACCRHNHYALDALAALCRAHRFAPEDVARVRVTTVAFGVRMADPEPPNMLAAKFSIPYAVAAALVRGRADVSAFALPVRDDPRVRALARRVEVHADPDMSPLVPSQPTARVRIELNDGRILEETTTVVRGDALNPVPSADIVEKFLALACPVLGESRAQRIIDTIHEVDTLKDIRDLTASLSPVVG